MTVVLENYKQVIEEHFGADTCTFNINSNETNNVIGALSHTQFDEFSKNFKERLQRLSEKVGSSTEHRGNPPTN